MPNMRAAVWVLVAAICTHAALAASDAVIQGVVTDNAGKPIRGALVKAASGYKSITRYSQKDGRYEIPVPAGNYAVTAEAYLHTSKRQSIDTAQGGATNFSLSPRLDVTLLTGAELESLLPDNAETRRIISTCNGCHNLQRLALKRGSTAKEWRSFLPTMTRGRLPVAADPQANPNFSEAKFTALTEALGKYFGPDAPYIGPDADPPAPERIQHADITDAALSATIREYEIPTPMPMAHSMSVDPLRGIAWWGEESHLANKIGRFDMATETFQEYPVLTLKATVHTGMVVRDGRYFVTLLSGGESKLASVDPATGKVTEYKWPEKKGNPHTLDLSKEGNLWMSGGASGEIWSFDVKTEQFGAKKFAVPPNWPEESVEMWQKAPGEPLPPVRAASYDIREDSKGTLWFTLYNMGTLMSLDPATGETKRFKPPGTPSMRGMAVDAHDNVWFTNYDGHKLGKLDAKTGAIKEYQPPTPNAFPYGIVVDDKTGTVWFSDLNGNHITRFDPRTEQFVEYPIPTREAGPKFMALDAQGRVWFTEVMGAKIGVLDPGDAGRQRASAR
jgi:virginiamycin B lyase